MDFKEFCADQIKEIQEDGAQEDLRTYQQAVLLVFYNAFLDGKEDSDAAVSPLANL